MASDASDGEGRDTDGRKRVKRRGLGAAMLGAAMVGLDEALNGPKDEPAITEVGNSTPDDDDPVALDLDPEDPAQSIAVVRPWLQ